MLIILTARLLCMLVHTDSYPLRREANVQSCSCAPLRIPCNFKSLHCSSRDKCKSPKENIALGKDVRIRTYFELKRIYKDFNPDTLGCLAVDGNLNSRFVIYERQKTNANCYRSAQHDPKPYWEVYLGRTYTITEITIVIDSTRKDLMINVEVYVNNDLCYKFTQVKIDDRHMTHIMCNKPLAGKIVRLLKETPTPGIKGGNIMSFCEVQVWVCNKGLFGQNCEKECSKGCNNCDNYNGMCASCAVGYYGMYCDELCKCSGNKCNVDGSCLETTTMPASQLVQRGPFLSPNVPGSQTERKANESMSNIVSETKSNIASESESNTTGIVIGVFAGIFVLFTIGGGLWWYGNRATAKDSKNVSRKGSSKKSKRKGSSKKSKRKDSSKTSKKKGSSKKKSSSKKSRK